MDRARVSRRAIARVRSLAALALVQCVFLLAALMVPVGKANAAPSTQPVTTANTGEAIFQKGVLGSGEPVEAMHDG
ncbi:cytochrome C, partial [Paraburkholderia dipogonis]